MEDFPQFATDLGAAAVVMVWLWKGVLPELRAMRAELRAIEKHLANAGQARVPLEGAVKEIGEGVDFLVANVQASNGRTTKPEERNSSG